MRPSKGEMLQRLQRVEDDRKHLSERLDRAVNNLRQLENVVDELVHKSGYRLVHKNGYYLEPVQEEPYGN